MGPELNACDCLCQDFEIDSKVQLSDAYIIRLMLDVVASGPGQLRT